MGTGRQDEGRQQDGESQEGGNSERGKISRITGTPVRRCLRWTEPRRQLFLAELAATCNISHALRVVGMSGAGNELIQFGRADPLGGGRWRLSRLLRGRRGTEASAGEQRPGDGFTLLESDSVRTLDLPLAALGSEVRVMATGLGDATPAEAQIMLRGVSVVPPAPAHLTWAMSADGSAVVRWVRRSRSGWRWTNGVDAPLSEESEVYRVTMVHRDGRTGSVDVGQASLAIDAATLAEGLMRVEVRQRGTLGESMPAIIELEKGTS